jgi:hypothetical protein
MNRLIVFAAFLKKSSIGNTGGLIFGVFFLSGYFSCASSFARGGKR